MILITNPGLLTAAVVRELLARHGLAPLKKLGQHFLTDGHVLQKILGAAAPCAEDLVLEIGPGLGALTQGLLASAGKVLAVELDKGLADVLAVEFHGEVAAGRLEIVRGDVLKTDLSALIAPHRHLPCKVVANLPYYITTPVILRLLEAGIPFRSLTVMVQKEVAQRMAAKPGTKAYGSLTLAVQYRAAPEIVCTVPKSAFHPRPEVDSAVVILRTHAAPPVETDPARLFAVIQAAFATRRKTLVNALHAAGFATGADAASGEPTAGKAGATGKAALAAVLIDCNLRPDIRGEALDIFQFAAVADRLHNHPTKGTPHE